METIYKDVIAGSDDLLIRINCIYITKFRMQEVSKCLVEIYSPTFFYITW